MSTTTISILSDGQPINPSFILLAVDIQYELNKIPYARIDFGDGEASKQEFKLSNSDYFVPGKLIEIKIRDKRKEDEEVTLFKGIITKHAVDAAIQISCLSLELKDKAVRMCNQRRNRVYQNQSDSTIFNQMAETHQLELGKIKETSVKHAEMVQYYASDWDFMLARAEANGLWVHAFQNVLNIVDPADVMLLQPSQTFTYGIDEFHRLHFTLDAGQQIGTVNSNAWDQQKLEPTEAAAADFKSEAGNLDPKSLAKAVGTENFTLQSAVPLSSKELQPWADAKIKKSRIALLRGNFTLPGRADLEPFQLIKITGISDRFNGKVIVSGIRHRISTDGWFTDVQFGLPSLWFTEKHDVNERQAAGLLPAIHGLQIGIVDAFEADPEEQYRVKVKLPAFGSENEATWARLAQADAGNNRGHFFYPEPGDEVVIGFFNDDPRQAVILGGLYSQSQPPVVESDSINADNYIKGIFSKAGIQIKLDDEKKQLELITSENQSITLNEEDKSIEIKDLNDNIITMDENGISIKSAKNITIEASENVVIKGKKVDIQ